MPMNFNLEEIREEHNCDTYLETGLYYATKKDASIHQAINSKFSKIYSIELRKDLVYIGNNILREEISTGRVKLINDDSNNLLSVLTNESNKESFNNKTLFFLDAHVDNQNIRNFKNMCPLFNEIDAISKLFRKDNIILIDDLRILNQEYPWGEQSYGKINFIEKIKEKILEINSEYKFKTLNGYVDNDVLMCYI